MHVVHLWQLLIYEGQVLHIGANVNLVRIHKLRYSVVCLLKQGAPRAAEVQKLLWLAGTAHWPQPLSYASSQYQTKVSIAHVTWYFYPINHNFLWFHDTNI
jgi:hypothetical protein